MKKRLASILFTGMMVFNLAFDMSTFAYAEERNEVEIFENTLDMVSELECVKGESNEFSEKLKL